MVVGAGITGAGIARDASMRGFRVLVLEAADVAFGTSSRSSRLIHGGVRYLERGELGLVFEALRERERLYHTAGHLVRPARFLFPAYQGDRLPLWKLRVGLSLYDALSFYRAAAHRSMGAIKAREMEPLLAAAGLRGAVSYEDALTDDARLTLTTLQSARCHGAEVLTYAPVRAITKPAGGELLQVALDDAQVHARAVIVATGPWTSERLLGEPGRELLTLSRGVHLVVRRDDVPVRQPLVVQVPDEQRIVFVVPWGARTYLGTTDTAYVGDPARASVEDADLEDLFGHIGRVVPAARLSRDRIVSAWSGVRPLVRPSRSRSLTGATVEVSRRHRILVNELGVIGVVGGKLTTFRAMAEEAVERALRGIVGGKLPPCETHGAPLVDGAPLTAAELVDPLIADLAPRHGATARQLAARVAAAPELGARLVDDLPYREVEVAWAVEREGCTHLVDILRRRLPLALTDPRRGAGVARRVAEQLVAAWGGRQGDVDSELERYREDIARESGRNVNV